MGIFGELKDYKPQPISEGGGNFKADGLGCRVEYARYEVGDREWNMGHKLVRIALVVADGSEYSGRWLFVDFDMDKPQPEKGKSHARKFADIIHATCDGQDITALETEAEFLVVLEDFMKKALKVNAWISKYNGNERQVATIKGLYDGELDSDDSADFPTDEKEGVEYIN